MEICDIFDGSGTPTGKKVQRGTVLSEGEYYLAVQVWIKNQTGNYLIQQRAWHLASGPGMWATTAGYVLSGEESRAGAIREVKEELGLCLPPECLSKFARLAVGNLMQDIWLAQSHEGQPVLGSEVCNWKWASKHDIKTMITRGEFFAYSYFDQLPE